jgi:uncharacterized Fe-S cluster-containing MiaB family protein
MPNPMHRLWNDGRWNKMTVAHGCYWKKCSFCDIHLDYIGRYDKATAEHLANQMEELIAETGETEINSAKKKSSDILNLFL